MANESVWERLHFAVIELATSTAALDVRARRIADDYLQPLLADNLVTDADTRQWIGRILAAIASGNADRISQALIDIVTLYDEVTRQDNDALQVAAA